MKLNKFSKHSTSAAAALGFATLMLAATGAHAITREQCLGMGGTWDGTPIRGLCKIPLTAAAVKPKADKPITREQCRLIGGTVNEKTGECLVGTKGITAQPQNSRN